MGRRIDNVIPQSRGWLAFLGGLLLASSVQAEVPDVQTLFARQTGGYSEYRIPSLLVTQDGSILVFCEGRRNGLSDSGDIDLLMRRSSDQGRSFGPVVVLWDDGDNTCGNPCVVQDRKTGLISLLLTHNLGSDDQREIINGEAKSTRTVWIMHSEDDGQTWSPPTQITSAVKKPEWRWYATGPGCGIQMRTGRLVIPCDHSVGPATSDMYSHVIFSDDGGRTWQMGGVPGPYTDECEVAELSDGQLMLNMRHYNPQGSYRAISQSADGGQTWTKPIPHKTLVEPTCQASFRRYSWPTDSQPGLLIFSNPASQKKREKLTIRLSRDDGQTWPVSRVLQPGKAAYSCLGVLPNGEILCFYENNQDGAELTLARFTLDWVQGK